MTTGQAEEISRATQLVDDDKFDRHMTKARLQDIDSRAKMFCEHTTTNVEDKESRKELQSSIY